jgi:hypothetical protein
VARRSQAIVRSGRSERAKDIELMVLRHQLEVLGRQIERSRRDGYAAQAAAGHKLRLVTAVRCDQPTERRSHGSCRLRAA